MNLKDCSIYAYVPEEDPYDGDEGAIWSFNYFFFNKARKRVCYLYLKSLSIISHSLGMKSPIKMKRSADFGWPGSEPGSSKRARYWLGDHDDVSSAWHDEDDEDEYDLQYRRAFGCDGAQDEEPETGTKEPRVISPSLSASSGPSRKSRSRSKSRVRGVSEDVAELIEV